MPTTAHFPATLNSYATGAVAGRYAGGLVGALEIYTGFDKETSVIKDSYATGAVEGSHAAGGLIGVNWYGALVATSYAIGPADGVEAGGFAGVNLGIIRDSYSSGSVTGKRNGGGFVGHNLVRGAVRRSYTYGEVNLPSDAWIGAKAGGLVGMHDSRSTVTDSYWDTTASRRHTTASDISTGKTTTQLQTPTGYTGVYTSWHVDVDNADGDHNPASNKDEVWDFGTSSQYPALKADWDGNGTATAAEFGSQARQARQRVNEAPAFANASVTLRVAENTAVNTNIGAPVKAADPDGDPLTYTLGTTADDRHFAIDAGSGQMQTKGALDYEGKSSYTVTVTATDGGGLSASIAVTITVTDVADTPPGQPDAPGFIKVKETRFRVTWTAPAAGSSAITGYGIQYKLNSAADSAYADVKPTPTGTGTGYNLVNRSGQTVTKGTSYAVRVRASNTEGWGPWSAPAVATTAGAAPVSAGAWAPANQTPAFAATTATVSVAENTAAGANIGSPVAANDPNAGDTLTYTLGTTADDDHFAINAGSGQLQTQGALDYEGQSSYTVTVTATDGGGLTASIAVTVSVTNVNEAPAYANASASLSVAENTATGADIGAPVTAADPDAGDTLTYTLGTTADDGHFAIDAGSGQLQTQGALDYEGQSSYSVTVTATDSDGLAASIAIAINLTNVNEAPAYANANASASLSVAENTAAGTDIGAPVTAADPDAGDTLTYTLGTTADDGHFAIDAGSGQLQTKGALDYEGQSSYSVTVTATDGGGMSASIAVTISVTDVADTPPGQPAAPEFISIAETRFRIKWTAPAAGFSAITGYGIQYKLNSAEDSAYADVNPTPTGTGTGYNLVNRSGQTVTKGTSYAVRVRASNAEGWGPWSDAAVATTTGAAPVPAEEESDEGGAEQEPESGDYQATAVFITTQGRVVLKWDEVSEAVRHTIEKDGQLLTSVGRTTRYYDSDVAENARYEYRITAYGDDGAVLAVMTAATG